MEPPPLTAEFQLIRENCPILVSTGCTQQFCQSGRSQHTDDPRVGENREIKMVQHEAIEFLREMWRAGQFESEQQCEDRISAVLAEIGEGSQDAIVRQTRETGRVGGNWIQSFKELEFGVRRAWLNARKCIMRSHHEELVLRDFRGVQSSEEMVRELFNGMIESFDNGNLNVTVFLFLPRSINDRGPMIWNQSVTQYAGYENEDGTILGDPASVQFTKDAIALGWEPPVERSRYDFLPLILMAEGDAPVIAELPAILRGEVHIRHPKYMSEFERLDLRYYKFPALGRFGFDIGGVQYTAAPFMGWWSDSEVTVRNLADTFRYNVLPGIVRVLRAREEDPETMNELDDLPEYEKLAWLSRAQTELTYATTWSFRQARVTFMDTLTASAQYCKFDDDFRKKTGYRLPADPYWLAPPQGSIIPLWHRGGAPNYQPKPVISRHVQDPMKSWNRERQKLLSEGKPAHVKIIGQAEYIGYSRAPVNQMVSKDVNGAMPHKVSIRRTRRSSALSAMISVKDSLTAEYKGDELSVSIHFCSSGTTARKLGNRLYHHLQKSLPSISNVLLSPLVEQLDALNLFDLTSQRVVLLIVSTTGQGDIPANGRVFVEMCQKAIDAAPEPLVGHFRFAIFGNGDRAYRTFYNAAALKIQNLLLGLGGFPLGAGFIEADTSLSAIPYATIEVWSKSIMADLLKLGGAGRKDSIINLSAPDRELVLELATLNGVRKQGRRKSEPQRCYLPLLERTSTQTPSLLIAQRSKLLRNEFIQAMATEIKSIPIGDSKGSIRVTLDIGDEMYKDLSCIQIVPANSLQDVDLVLSALCLDGSQVFQLGTNSNVAGLTYKQFFTDIVDLQAPFIDLSWIHDLLAIKGKAATICPFELTRTPKAIDIINLLPALGLLGLISEDQFVRKVCLAMPLLSARTYSIASANGYHKNQTSSSGGTCNLLDIWVKRLPEGRFSHTFLNDCSLPAPLKVRIVDAAYSQTLREWGRDVPLVLIATGAGFGPVQALIQRQIVRARNTAFSKSARALNPLSSSCPACAISVFLGLKACDAATAFEIIEEAQAVALIDIHCVVPSNPRKVRIQDRFADPDLVQAIKTKILKQKGLVFVCSGPLAAREIQAAMDELVGGSIRRILKERFIQEVF